MMEGREDKAEKFPLHSGVSEEIPATNTATTATTATLFRFLSQARFHAKCFAYIISVDPHNKAIRLVSLSPSRKWRNWISERWVICFSSHSLNRARIKLAWTYDVTLTLTGVEQHSFALQTGVLNKIFPDKMLPFIKKCLEITGEWLIHVNVWQKPLQYCKVISLQLIKKKKRNHWWVWWAATRGI